MALVYALQVSMTPGKMYPLDLTPAELSMLPIVASFVPAPRSARVFVRLNDRWAIRGLLRTEPAPNTNPNGRRLIEALHGHRSPIWVEGAFQLVALSANGTGFSPVKGADLVQLHQIIFGHSHHSLYWPRWR